MTETSSSVSFKDLTEQEVKIHKGRRRGSWRWLFVVLILCVAGLAGWYYMLLLPGDPVAHQAVEQVEKRMEMPERPPQPQESGDQALVSEIPVTVAVEQPDDVVMPIIQDPAIVVATESLPAVLDGVDVSEAIPVPASEAKVPPEGTGPSAVAADPLYRVLVGPIVSSEEVERAMTVLTERGFRPQPQSGTGTVDMIRLLEGIYPLAQAQERLAELQEEFPSAFLLPDGDRWALFIGSFSDRDRARRQQRALAERQIQVAQVDSQLSMTGTLLMVARTDEQTAEGIAAELRSIGLRVRLELER